MEICKDPMKKGDEISDCEFTDHLSFLSEDFVQEEINVEPFVIPSLCSLEMIE